MALARYIVRMRGSATPFGLFAGAALAQADGPADGTWHPVPLENRIRVVTCGSPWC